MKFYWWGTMIPQSRLTRWILPFLWHRDAHKYHCRVLKENTEEIERARKNFEGYTNTTETTPAFLARKPEQVTDQFEERYGEKNW